MFTTAGLTESARPLKLAGTIITSFGLASVSTAVKEMKKTTALMKKMVKKIDPRKVLFLLVRTIICNLFL
jgi:hypothetical protein